ncbi:hypothetical protein MTR67_031394 [Solanum verrucosum]|uniref:Uncharacterized protein n=1 Tax=Solanum verrucosum TaxID=315347 RepID=A0AAF0U2E9_SOLVR|nr:hypothetical protein MTR67_031394 [Solanum verrucosum]
MNLRQHRWLELLKDYGITILYHLRKVNVVADALSRNTSSMGSLSTTSSDERPLARNVQREVQEEKRRTFKILASFEDFCKEFDFFEVCKLRTNEVASVKVLWSNQFVEEATSEAEEDMKKRYPHLFSSKEIPDQGVRLMSISDGGVTVQNGSESSLVVEVKEKSRVRVSGVARGVTSPGKYKEVMVREFYASYAVTMENAMPP